MKSGENFRTRARWTPMRASPLRSEGPTWKRGFGCLWRRSNVQGSSAPSHDGPL
jgi:hypothetical protein